MCWRCCVLCEWCDTCVCINVSVLSRFWWRQFVVQSTLTLQFNDIMCVQDVTLVSQQRMCGAVYDTDSVNDTACSWLVCDTHDVGKLECCASLYIHVMKWDDACTHHIVIISCVVLSVITVRIVYIGTVHTYTLMMHVVLCWLCNCVHTHISCAQSLFDKGFTIMRWYTTHIVHYIAHTYQYVTGRCQMNTCECSHDNLHVWVWHYGTLLMWYASRSQQYCATLMRYVLCNLKWGINTQQRTAMQHVMWNECVMYVSWLQNHCVMQIHTWHTVHYTMCTIMQSCITVLCVWCWCVCAHVKCGINKCEEMRICANTTHYVDHNKIGMQC